jgi:AcrR family transcriptional regulator
VSEVARIPSARERGRQARHERILDAAARLFAAQGFTKTAVDEIAAEAGVSKGLVYDHYASKEDLLAAVFWRLVAQWDEETIRGARFSEDEIPESLARVLRSSIQALQRNPLLRRILTQDLKSLLPLERENAVAFVRRYCARLEPVLARGVRTGQLRRDLDTAHTAEVIWALHAALAPGLMMEPDGRWRADGDALLQSAIDLVIRGIRP